MNVAPKHLSQVVVKGDVIGALVSWLAVDRSAWFEVLPLPDDEYQVSFKKENDTIVQQFIDAKRDDLVGRRILAVRPMTSRDAAWMFWDQNDLPLTLLLDDGKILFPSSDCEGNDHGYFFAKDTDGKLLSYA